MENMEEKNITQGENEAVEETVTEEMTADEQVGAEERKFTQKEVDDIVRRRLERERKKYESLVGDGEYFKEELLKREKAVMGREMRVLALERLKSENIPEEAAALLNFNSMDEFEASCETLIRVFNPIMKKAVGDAVGAVFRENGRTPRTGTENLNPDTLFREAFRP